MDFIAVITACKSLLEMVQEIAKIVKRSYDSPDVTKSVLLYLKAARAAVYALGLERQRILTDVRKCDAGDPDQVNALWVRLDRYLHEDNIRPQLVISIHGLDICRAAIERKAEGVWWRKRSKEAAVQDFSNTLNELESMLQGLTSNFFPGRSGMEVKTLVPIFELVSEERNYHRHPGSQDIDLKLIHEKLGELASQALRDDSHENWFRMTGKVEALIAELQLAFSVKVTKGQ